MSTERNCSIFSSKPKTANFKVELYSSVKALPLELTNKLEQTGEIHLSPVYLLALESAEMPNFEQYISAFSVDGKLVGFSVYQVVNMESDLPGGYMNVIPAWKLLFTRSQTDETAIYARVLVGGDVFGSGVKLFRFNDDINESEQWKMLNEGAKAVEGQRDEKIDFWLIKDFIGEDSPEKAASEEASLTKVYSEPVMNLVIRPEWKGYEDYLSAMRTKYRTKAKAAYKRSSSLRFEEWTHRQIEAQADNVMLLYDRIWRNSNFRPGKINAQVLINWKSGFGEDCRVQGYYLNDELVGMQLGLLKNDVLDAILVSFNPDLNRDYSILETMLNEFVKWGIEDRVKEIKFGRTAGELKSTIGAEPIPAFGMVKHTRPALNRVAKWIGPLMKPQDFPVRQPFKDPK